MDHCPSTEQLRALLADELTDPDAQVVEVHAASCSRCQEVLERLADSWSNLDPRQAAVPGPATEPHVRRGDDEGFFRKLQNAPPWNASPPQPAADGRLPELPGYAVLGKLGAGGMGVVYQVRDV